MNLRNFRTAVIVVVAVTLIGAVWETMLIEVFASRAGQLKGMIANPRPYDYVNSDYTPHGRQYELWAFKVPLAGTAVLLLIAGVTSTVELVRGKLGRRVLALWAIILMCGVLFLVMTACFYVVAVNVFI
jgi:hypothetical protein